ncbi:MAG: TrkH family potassium uptake protein, partial [Proteobacteria bacterium]|nr:TrkH family potassium uptake protein [Pseudomonadota bacterium]
MNYKLVFFSLGLIIALIGIFMLIPALADYAQGRFHNAATFSACGIAGFFIGTLTAISNNNFEKRIGIREGFLMTTLCWLTASFFASLPFHFSDLHLTYADSFFEAASGVTTTGSTVITGLEQKSPGILLWRSLTQWIGGMGMIALSLIFLPFLRVGGMQLFQTESSDRSEKIMPHTADIVKGIVIVYAALTLLCALTYAALGMTAFESVNHAMTTLSTGGFGTRDSSLGLFSPTLQWSAILFMFLGGLPFILYIKAVYKCDLKILLADAQVQAFFTFVLAVTIVMTGWAALHEHLEFHHALRHSLFNIVSVVTTTGFATADYLQWDSFSSVVFLFLTYIGACSGSTAGGIKIMRLQIVALNGISVFKKFVYPNGVFSAFYQGRPLTAPVVQSVMVFLFLYVFCNVVLTLLLALTGLDFETSISGAATAIANVGPGIGSIIGPAGNFSTLPDTSKILLAAGMILGRLELMTVLVLFHPSFW